MSRKNIVGSESSKEARQERSRLATIKQATRELNEELNGYDVVDLTPDKSLLDGYYTPAELRKIADKMEQLAKQLGDE